MLPFQVAQYCGISVAAMGGLTLPPGALAVWSAYQYAASPKPYIPNSVAATPIAANIWSASSRLFTVNDYWLDANGCTATDNVSGDFSRIVGTGTLQPARTVPAGTYTFGYTAKSNTGVSQTVKMDFGSNAISEVFTVTTAEREVVKTVTLAVPEPNLFLLRSPDNGTTPIDLLFKNARGYVGSSDLGPDTFAGHMSVGVDKFDTRPTYASGLIDLSASKAQTLAQFAAATTFNTITVMAVVSKVSLTGLYDVFLGAANALSTLAAASSWDNGAGGETLDSYFGGQSFVNTAYAKFKSLWTFNNKGPHVATVRYDGTKLAYFLDDILLYERTQAISPPSIADFASGVTNASAYSGLKIAAIALWNRNLSNAEVRQAYSFLVARVAASGNTITTERIVAFDGDSIPGGTISGDAQGGYPNRFGGNASPAVHGGNYAVGGSTMTELVARAAALDAIIPPAPNGRKFILHVLIGHNDLVTGGYNQATFLAALSAYCDARRAARPDGSPGWIVVLCTLLPSTVGSFNTNRGPVNTAIRGWVGTHIDACCDFAADATMGPDGAAGDTILYSDGTHPTATGHINLEAIMRPIINGL